MSENLRIAAPAGRDAEPILEMPRENGIHAVAAASSPAHQAAETLAERDRLLDELRSERETLKTMLSDRKRAESALIESEKLAAVGRLAASISHEINNPLEAVTNLLYLIRAEDGLSDRAMTYLSLAERELARVSQIAGQTLRFHRQSTKPTRITPQDLLESVVALYQGRLLNARIDLVFDHCGATAIDCYEGDIRHVLNNLLGNAIDSMGTGGRLVIRTHDSVCWRDHRCGVRITIADTGYGMSSEVRQRIFEAFYTTKGLGGNGLGLWISKGIVEKHQGSLSVRSSNRSPHTGTVFSLFLPRSLDPEA
jgi:signal transduction histidine kinase